MHRPNALLLVATLLVFPLCGCSSWRPLPEADPTAHAAPLEFDGTTRLTLRSGEQVVVEYPTFAADSVRGFRVDRIPPEKKGGRSKEIRSRYAVVTSEVARVEKRQAEAGKTVLLVLGIVGGIVLIATIPWWAG